MHSSNMYLFILLKINKNSDSCIYCYDNGFISINNWFAFYSKSACVFIDYDCSNMALVKSHKWSFQLHVSFLFIKK